jgi:asparagine synthase (glutamine-hydrolysing)
VAITGEGADELFAGYSIFKEDRIRRFWARSPESTMRPALLARIHPEIGRVDARRNQFWSSFFGQGLGDTHNPLFSHLPRWNSSSWTTRLLSKEILATGSVGASLERVEAELPPGVERWSALARAQTLEILTFMSPYLLAAQGDRVALGHGVEVRYPYLDTALVDFALRLPDRFKLQGLRDKVVLRRAAARELPADIWQRPKQPFRAPTSSALVASIPSDSDDLLSASAVKRLGLLDAEAVSRLIDRARRLGGRMAGEREEMALVGATTLQVWGTSFFEQFDDRAVSSLGQLRRTAPRVLERHPGDRAEIQVVTI